MKILYGVVGEGLGHAMRSRVVLEHLVSQKHEVEIIASGRAVDFLKRRFAGVNAIHGLHMIYEENRVAPGKTLISNVVTGARGVPQNVAAYFDVMADFKPQAVISDFESWTYLYAKTHRLPILSVDNMQIIHRTKLPDAATEGHYAEFRLTKAFIKSKLPWCDDYFITTFFRPPVRKKRTRLFPPILRPEVIAAVPRRGEHLLVYTTGEGNETFVQALAKTGFECRIYGIRRNIEEEQVEGNLRFRPFNETSFIDDLASCKAVIGGGGFTLMGEAVSMRKPMLAVPVAHQFEQVLNARYLALEGFGKCAETLNDSQVVVDFIAGLPEFDANLATVSHEGNGEILSAIDEWLDKASVGVV